ncbi:hypothetical protein BGX38DRAFT_533698 [Terfezia claveryi]|nr:hypothetical protein BGX38DRAFT_533698 [Terfezia claveryi]
MKKSTSHRFLSVLISTTLLLAFLSCETSLPVDAKRVFRPDRLDAAKLELVHSVTAHQLSKTTPGTFIAGNTKELGKRDGLVGKRDDEKCRHVHHAKNKCKFIRENCADESVGLLNYLDLYYCELPHAPVLALITMAVWLGILFTSSGSNRNARLSASPPVTFFALISPQ